MRNQGRVWQGEGGQVMYDNRHTRLLATYTPPWCTLTRRFPTRGAYTSIRGHVLNLLDDAMLTLSCYQTMSC